MTDLAEAVARKLSVQMFGSSWAGLTDAARRLALGEARGVLAIVTPLVLEDAADRVTEAFGMAPTDGCECGSCAFQRKVCDAVWGRP